MGLRISLTAEWTDMSENQEQGQSWRDTSARFAEPGWRTGAQRRQWGSLGGARGPGWVVLVNSESSRTHRMSHLQDGFSLPTRSVLTN